MKLEEGELHRQAQPARALCGTHAGQKRRRKLLRVNGRARLISLSVIAVAFSAYLGWLRRRCHSTYTLRMWKVEKQGSHDVAIAGATTVLGSGGADARKGDAGGGKTGIWMGLRTKGHVARALSRRRKQSRIPMLLVMVGLSWAVRFLVLGRSCTAGRASGSASAWSLTGSIWLHAGAPMAAPRRQSGRSRARRQGEGHTLHGGPANLAV